LSVDPEIIYPIHALHCGL